MAAMTRRLSLSEGDQDSRIAEQRCGDAEPCKYPGCGQPAAPARGPGRPPEYCEGRGHTKVTAWRERRRLAAEQAGTTVSPAETRNPVTMAKVTGAELLRSLRGEADRPSGSLTSSGTRSPR
jgi:hypothetical protein